MKKKAAKPKPRTLARNAKGGKKGGEIVSAAYAKENPDTTVVESVETVLWRGTARPGATTGRARNSRRDVLVLQPDPGQAWIVGDDGSLSLPRSKAVRVKIIVDAR